LCAHRDTTLPLDWHPISPELAINELQQPKRLTRRLRKQTT
jgi:hypothetical protein